ncbi:hypothetical protein DUI87_30768 [Hirundo rustica rustica]|uniref:Uncharacterized protein n=1 Tax=Hirundo rustica rustica TaxID=333673 RepID=A0A3M0IVK3_HIRRU|nr:hypothetical protein DUI87_30768 [Hirundo rustica rustica]
MKSFILYWLQRQTLEPRMKKRLRYLLPSLPLSSTRLVILREPPLRWQTGTESRTDPVQERGSDLLSHLDTQKSMRLGGIHPSLLMELAKEFAKLLCITDHQFCLTGKVPDDLEVGYCDVHPQEGQENEHREVQA